MDKAVITKVGLIVDGQPRGWVFDCGGEVAAIDMQGDGSLLHAGYTIEELTKIAEADHA